MADSNFSAIRARLRYGSLDEFIDGYSRFIMRGGMFIPMAPAKLKPIGTTIRFQFLLEDGTTAMLGEGVVRQINGPEDDGSTVGMLVKFTKLSPDTKSLVDRVLRQKDEQAAPAAEDTLDSDDNPTAPAVQPEKAGEDPPTSELDPDDLDQTAEQDAVDESQQEPDTAAAEDDLFAEPEEELHSDPAATREGESRDAIGVSAAQEAPDEEDEDEAPGLSAGEVFSEAEEDSEAHPAQGTDDVAEDKAPPANAESTSSESPPPSDHKGQDGEKAGPRELGRTEAGLQIMAFDEVTDEDAEEFANFALGGEEDDVDQMFAGIFGEDGGGADDFLDDAFGGGGEDDGGGDPFGGALGGDGDSAENDLFGDAEGGAFGGANEDSFIADAEAKQREVEESASGEVILEPEDEISVDEGVSPMTNELHTEDIVEEEVVQDDGDLEDELQPQPQQVAHEQPDAPAPSPDTAGGEDIASALDELPQEQPPLDQDSAPEEILLEEESDEEEEESQIDREAIAAQLSGDEEPSEELVNLLGSLEDSEVEDAEIELQQLKEDIEEKVEAAEDDDEEESLESLLAQANAEIEAKQKQKEEEKDDILDDLLGDDLPPPPSEDAQFDMPLPDEKTQEEKRKEKEAAEKKKKKKGGFISKLFGKD